MKLAATRKDLEESRWVYDDDEVVWWLGVGDTPFVEGWRTIARVNFPRMEASPFTAYTWDERGTPTLIAAGFASAEDGMLIARIWLEEHVPK